MIIKKQIKVSVYEVTTSIYIVDEPNEIQKIVDKIVKNQNVLDTEGFVLDLSNRNYIICFMKKNISHNLIAHEVYHLGNHICKNLDIIDEEATAWVVGYVTECIYKILSKNKIEIK